jgi:general secretion pathway protein M
MDFLVNWFQSLAEREKRVVGGGGLIACALFVFVVLVPLDRSVSRAHQRLAHKQSDLAWMHSVAPQLASLGPPVLAPTSQRSLIAIVDASAREAGLGTAVTDSKPVGPGGLRVRLDKANFDIVVGWLARLSDQRGVRVESAQVDASGAPGLVNATILLRAAQ